MHIYNSKFTRKKTIILFPLLFIKYLPILWAIYKSTSKDLILQDISNRIKEYDIRSFAKLPYKINKLLGILWCIHNDTFYLPLLYYRLNYNIAEKISWCKKDNSTLMIYAKHIGANIIMHHPFSSIINAESIGDHFEFRNNLTIGNKDNDNTKIPRIGNNVVVGANVVIFGDITIGDNVKIGAGSVINKSIPSNCTVIGNPFRIINQKSN